MPSPLRLLAFSVLFGSALVGCTSSLPSVPSAPVESEMDEARAALSRAQEVGAETGAPTEYRIAAARLSDAQAALNARNSAQAARLAREATIDAQLAEASVLAARARGRSTIGAEVDQLRDAIRAQN